MLRHEKAIVAICFICILLIGIGIGYGIGFGDAIEWGVKFAKHFTSISFDEDMMVRGITQYKNNIDGCFFTDNSSIII